MANDYIVKEIERVIEKNKNSEYSLKMKIQGEFEESRWVNISQKEIQKMLETFKENK